MAGAGRAPGRYDEVPVGRISGGAAGVFRGPAHAARDVASGLMVRAAGRRGLRRAGVHARSGGGGSFGGCSGNCSGSAFLHQPARRDRRIQAQETRQKGPPERQEIRRFQIGQRLRDECRIAHAQQVGQQPQPSPQVLRGQPFIFGHFAREGERKRAAHRRLRERAPAHARTRQIGQRVAQICALRFTAHEQTPGRLAKLDAQVGKPQNRFLRQEERR